MNPADLTKDAVSLGVAIHLTRYTEEIPGLTDLLKRFRAANPHDYCRCGVEMDSKGACPRCD